MRWPLPCTPWAFRGPRALSHGCRVPPEAPVPSGAAGTLTEPRGGHCEVPFLIPGGQRPRRTPVTAASSPLFTSVFSSLITRFIAFARGKPGDGGAGEDAPRQPRTARGRGARRAQPGLPPPTPGLGRIWGGEGPSRAPEPPGGRCPTARPQGRLQRSAQTRCPQAERKKKKKATG